MPLSVTITGQLLDWNLQGSIRHVCGFLNYWDLQKIVEIAVFDAETGEGEQRLPEHAKKLKKEILEGRYVPTTFYLGTRDCHRDTLRTKDGIVTFEVNEDEKLAALDAGGRLEALRLIYEQADTSLKKKIQNLPIPYLITLDGDNREHFLAYNKGKPVSKDHMFSMQHLSGTLPTKIAPYMSLAREAGKFLNSRDDSFLQYNIRFDSSIPSSEGLEYSIKSLCATSARDIAFSLYGGARVIYGLDLDNQNKLVANLDGKWLANLIISVYNSILEDSEAVRLMDNGKVLCTDGKGAKTGVGLILGISNLLAERLLLQDRTEVTKEDLERVVQTALDSLNESFADHTHREAKCHLLRKYGQIFFEDMAEDDSKDWYYGLPKRLVDKLSPSTFKLASPPKEKKKRGRKAKPEEVLPNDVPVEEIRNEPGFRHEQEEDDEYFEEEDKEWEEQSKFLEEDSNEEESSSNLVTCEEIMPWEN